MYDVLCQWMKLWLFALFAIKSDIITFVDTNLFLKLERKLNLRNYVYSIAAVKAKYAILPRFLLDKLYRKMPQPDSTFEITSIVREKFT